MKVGRVALRLGALMGARGGLTFASLIDRAISNQDPPFYNPDPTRLTYRRSEREPDCIRCLQCEEHPWHDDGTTNLEWIPPDPITPID